VTSTHDFTATAADGSQVPLRDYAGKVLLIVNVASKCGLTPQYEGLQALYLDDRDRGLEIRPGTDGTDEVKWNFTKFLVGRDGTVLKRYEPPVPPADIKANLENYL
jgi:glutathione peroxidase